MAQNRSVAVDPPASAAPAMTASARPRESAAAIAPGAQWEMVVPKMDRPAMIGTSKTGTPHTGIAPVAQELEDSTTPVASEVSVPDDTGVPFASLLIAPPEPFSGRVRNAVTRVWNATSSQARIAAAGAIVVVAGSAFWLSSGTPPPATAGQWVRAQDIIGTKEAGAQKLIVFRTKSSVPDYRFEFDWKADIRGVGWIFRSSPINRSYQTAKISLVPNRSPATMLFERYSVLASVEGIHTKKFIQLLGKTPSIPVRLDTNGPAFNVYIENRLADSWIDERFTEGQAGFIIEPEGLPGIENVQLKFPHAPELLGYQGSFLSIWNSLP